MEGCEGRSIVPTYKIEGVVVNMHEKDSTKDDKENVQYSLKAKTVITIALSLDEFFRVSHYEPTKEIRDILQITRKGTT